MNRYVLPYHLHCASVYPFSAPNGSQVVVCGHENGLLILWRGGRPFKSPDSSINQLRRQDSSSGIAGVDEEGNAGIQDGYAEFEQEEEDAGSLQPYADIVQRLELPLGSAVLHLAFPRLPQLAKPYAQTLAPSLLERKIVVALGCADNSIRLLTLPLSPPPPSLASNKRLFEHPILCRAGHGNWGEELVTLSGAHQSLPKGVSVAFAPRVVTRDDEESSGDDMDEGREKRGQDVLLASHSADLSGIILVHRIPVSQDGMSLKTSPSKIRLWRSRPLASPASSVDLFVSDSSTSSQPPRLLVAESKGPVRIFECCSSHVPDQGRWALTLQPPLSSSRPNHLRSVLDARWILKGNAIAVLTVEGEWGIWDVSLRGGSRMTPGSKPTPFTISGRVGNLTSNAATLKNSTSTGEAKSQLAPMTPSTRKARQEALFGARAGSISNRGGISLKFTHTSFSGGEGDESMTIWHGDNAFTIPSLRTHWQTKFAQGGGSFFNSGAAGQARDIPSIDLGGEIRAAVSAFPKDDSYAAISLNSLDFLIAGERSLTILTPPRAEQEKASSALAFISQPNALIQSTTSNQTDVSDQMLLDHGELDVQGLDRMLDGMSGEAPVGIWSPTPTERRKTEGRRVGFV